MKTFFGLFMITHGLIHLHGLFTAFRGPEAGIVKRTIPKAEGFMWAGAAILFIATGILFLLDIMQWWIMAVVSSTLSQYLIFSNWNDAKWGTIVNILILVVTVIFAILYGVLSGDLIPQF